MSRRTNNIREIATASAVLFFVALFLASYTARNPQASSLGVALSTFILTPIQSGVVGIGTATRNVWRRYVDLTNVEMDNEQLRTRLSQLESTQSEHIELLRENDELRELLAMKADDRTHAIGAEVVGFDPVGWNRVVTINVGSYEGVVVGDPVYSHRGVVGQVVAVSGATARVMLIIDRASAVDVLLQDGRNRGQLRGTGVGATLDYVRSDSIVKAGAALVTSGLDGVFPKGLPVGTISEVAQNIDSGTLFHNIKVLPIVDFDRLEYVLVGKNLNFSSAKILSPNEQKSARTSDLERAKK